ncbi:MAG TPA: hypothetical protein VL547_10105 [Dinghuibacter sp.]|jgi:hypothetical protein|uniref:hypothetical protein n=1 Tax=Dinghuibacter sp. TaxID=2024697 RepID=UPI002BF54B47|nr:hypothetical protein [Dinghuibacter sp.]HTJ12368.1 hypothetical protein [Dinghuibacter sp.]
MKWTLLTLTLLPFCACKKGNDTVVTFAVNGKSCSYSGIPGNTSHVGYSSGYRLSYDFYFQGAFGDYFGIYVPGGAGFQASDGEFTDSLNIGMTYPASPSLAGVPPVKFFGEFIYPTKAYRFYVTITRNGGSSWDGTFSGYIEGENVFTGATEKDTISNGVFKNLPLTRTFD